MPAGPTLLTRWAGPALLVGWAVAAVTLAMVPQLGEGRLGWWLAANGTSAIRMLPLLGLGIAVAVAPRWHALAGQAIFGAGLAAGYLARDWLLELLGKVPDIATPTQVTVPLACLVAGLALVPGARLRPWLLPPMALLGGIAVWLTIALTDPSLHDPTIQRVGALLAFWLVAGVALTARLVRRRWFITAARIMGSWLLAMGALYGALSFAPARDAAPAPPPALPPLEESAPDSMPMPGTPFAPPGQIPGPPDPTPGLPNAPPLP